MKKITFEITGEGQLSAVFPQLVSAGFSSVAISALHSGRFWVEVTAPASADSALAYSLRASESKGLIRGLQGLAATAGGVK